MNKFLKNLFLIITAIFTIVISGLVVGACIGGLIAWLLGPSVYGDKPNYDVFFLVIFSAVNGVLVGLAVGTGTALLGLKSKFGSEWPVVSAAGTILGLGLLGFPITQITFDIHNPSFNDTAFFLTLVVVSAFAGWIISQLIAKRFHKQVLGDMKLSRAVLIYFVVFVSIVLMTYFVFTRQITV